MGNQWSATKNSILVVLDRPAYQPGDLVQGVVALNVVSPLNIKCIELQVREGSRRGGQPDPAGAGLGRFLPLPSQIWPGAHPSCAHGCRWWASSMPTGGCQLSQ